MLVLDIGHHFRPVHRIRAATANYSPGTTAKHITRTAYPPTSRPPAQSSAPELADVAIPITPPTSAAIAQDDIRTSGASRHTTMPSVRAPSTINITTRATPAISTSQGSPASHPQIFPSPSTSLHHSRKQPLPSPTPIIHGNHSRPLTVRPPP